MIKKLGRFLLRSIVLLGKVVAAIAVLMLAINLYDEPLRPEIAALTQPSNTPAIPDSDNASFFAYGMTASPGLDPFEVGMHMVEQQRQWHSTAIEKRDMKYVEHWQAALGEHPLVIPDIKDWPCDRQFLGCLPDKHRLPEIRKLLADNAVLLDRYSHLLSYRHFIETRAPGLPVPAIDLKAVFVARRLWILQIGLSLESGNAKDWLVGLTRDAQFWRRYMAEGPTYDARLALSFVSVDMEMLSIVIRQHPELAVDARENLQAVLSPVSEEEKRSVERSAEMRFRDAQMLLEIDEYDSCDRSGRSICRSPGVWFWKLFGRPLYKPNATRNMLYGQCMEQATLADAPLPEFKTAVTSYFIQHDIARDMTQLLALRTWRQRLYNLHGKLQVARMEPVCDYFKFEIEYLEGVYRLDGLLRLLALQLEITAQGLRDEQIPAFLQSMVSQYSDPFTGKAMSWDPSTRAIYYVDRNGYEKPPGRIEVRL